MLNILYTPQSFVPCFILLLFLSVVTYCISVFYSGVLQLYMNVVCFTAASFHLPSKYLCTLMEWPTFNFADSCADLLYFSFGVFFVCLLLFDHWFLAGLSLLSESKIKWEKGGKRVRKEVTEPTLNLEGKRLACDIRGPIWPKKFSHTGSLGGVHVLKLGNFFKKCLLQERVACPVLMSY